MDAIALEEDLKSLGFTPSLAKPKMGRWEDKSAAHKKSERNESGWLVGEVETSQRGEVG